MQTRLEGKAHGGSKQKKYGVDTNKNASKLKREKEKERRQKNDGVYFLQTSGPASFVWF